MRVPVPETDLEVRELGAGPPIVLVHGGTGTGLFDWHPVLDRLGARHRLVLIDLRGHGGSPDPGWRLGMTRFGLDVAHVMRGLGIPRALLVGFSVGANSLIDLVGRWPERAVGLVTIGASAQGDPARVERILSGPWPEELKGLEHAVSTGPDYWRELRAALARDWAANVAFSAAHLGRITCPTLVVHGALDRVVLPEQAELLAGAMPTAELWVAPRAGHMVQRDQPDAFAQQVQGLAQRLSW